MSKLIRGKALRGTMTAAVLVLGAATAFAQGGAGGAGGGAGGGGAGAAGGAAG
ncbi:hypothetical protein HPY24_19415, partial [Methylobacterium sp. IIF1SW-B5]|nr:hypothetical protein [Methylobacterium ajmalii]